VHRGGRALLGLSLLLSLAALLARPAQAAEHNVVIQGFEYRPSTVEIAPGDTVAWTNLDATVHTVTAEDGSFDSGRLDQGQRYAVVFNRPGTYTYFCELHDFHRGSVIVRGAAPPPPSSTTTAPPSTTSTTEAGQTTVAPAPPSSAPPASGATDTGSAAGTAGAPSAPEPAGQAPSGSPAPSADAREDFQVVSAPTAPAGAPVAPLPIIGSILALAGALAAQLWALWPRVLARGLRMLAAAGTLLSGAIHLQLRLDISYPEPIDSLFIAQAAASVVLAGALVLTWSRIATWAGVAFHVAALGAFALSRTVGLLGFDQAGWDPSPEAAVAVAVELSSLALLVAVSVRRHQVASP